MLLMPLGKLLFILNKLHVAATHVLMIGSEGTLDYSVDPEGKVYADRAQTSGGDSHGAMLMIAKEYPVGSGSVVACGGINHKANPAWAFTTTQLCLRGCERYVLDMG